MLFCAICRIGRNKTPIETGAEASIAVCRIPLLVEAVDCSFVAVARPHFNSELYTLVASAHKHKCLYVISIVLPSLPSDLLIPASKLRMQRIGTAPVQMFFMLLKPLSSVHQGYRYVGETSVALTYYLYRLLII